MTRKLLILAAILYLAATTQTAEATLYVGNLGNLWTDGGIGDIHGLFPGGTPYGSDTARFTTGAGYFSINAITLEFEFDPGYPTGSVAPQWISIQLFQGSSLLGGFGNPLVNPTPTQWPQSSNPGGYTQFIDFSPLQPIILNPLTQYSIVASMPANSPVSAALLFTRSSAYDSPAGWVMGATTTGNPFANGEHLVMAVDASPVPEPNTAALLLGGLLVLMGRWKSLGERTNRKIRNRPSWRSSKRGNKKIASFRMNTLCRILPNARLLAASLALLVPALTQAETAILAWVQRYNGSGNNTDNPQAVAVDSNNNVIVTGSSYGGSSGFDYATVRYSSEGVPLWTQRFNGPENGPDGAVAVVVDGSNNVLVTGYSGVGTNNDYVTIKYSAAGLPLWTNRYGGPGGGDARPHAAAVDQSNNVIVTGSAGGAYATVQYSNAGVPLWTNRYNGPASGGDGAVAVAVDASNSVIVTGSSAGGGVGTDYVTIKYSNAGLPLWTNCYDGLANSIDEPSALAVDSGNNVLVTGRSVGRSGYYSFATIKYSSQGAALWTNCYWEPTGTTAYANAIAVDRDNNVLVTGYYFAGLYENYATIKYSNAGAPLWTNCYNGQANGTDISRAVTVDDNNNVLVTGYSSGDYATIKYSNTGVPLWTNRYNGPGNGGDSPWAMVLDHNGDVIVTGQSDGGGSGFDYATLKFLSPPVISDAQITNGLYQIRMRRPNRVVIETSTDLINWRPSFTNATSTNLLIYADPNTGSSPRRFYRTVRAL